VKIEAISIDFTGNACENRSRGRKRVFSPEIRSIRRELEKTFSRRALQRRLAFAPVLSCRQIERENTKNVKLSFYAVIKFGCNSLFLKLKKISFNNESRNY
jgi:hypothetical protein